MEAEGPRADRRESFRERLGREMREARGPARWGRGEVGRPEGSKPGARNDVDGKGRWPSMIFIDGDSDKDIGRSLEGSCGKSDEHGPNAQCAQRRSSPVSRTAGLEVSRIATASRGHHLPGIGIDHDLKLSRSKQSCWGKKNPSSLDSRRRKAHESRVD